MSLVIINKYEQNNHHEIEMSVLQLNNQEKIIIMETDDFGSVELSTF